MSASNFNKFIEDFSSLRPSDSSSLERILKKFPYFQTAALFLAKSNPIQQNTQTAALRSADRRVLRSWLDENYRKELEKAEREELEAKKIALETENNQNNQDLDIDTESINAFDKLVETNIVVEEEKLENTYQEKEISTENVLNILEEKETIQDGISENTPINNFFDELENEPSLNTENQIDSSHFFEELEENGHFEQTEKAIENYDTNFFDEVDKVSEKVVEIEKIEEPLFFKEPSDINEPLLDSPILEIPTETTDANFFDQIEEVAENKFEEPLFFKEQSDINEPLLDAPILEIPTETTDANFFDQIEEVAENKFEEPLFKKQSDTDEPLLDVPVTEIPPKTTDTNFFDEIEGDDTIFGDAQKDLDNYDAPDFSGFPDFEEEKEEMDKNKKTNEDKSFFDDI